MHQDKWLKYSFFKNRFTAFENEDKTISERNNLESSIVEAMCIYISRYKLPWAAGCGCIEKSNYSPVTLLLWKNRFFFYHSVIHISRKEKSFASLRSHQLKQCNFSQKQGKSKDEIRTLWVIAFSLFYFGNTTSVSYPLFKDIQNWIPCIFIKD